MNVSLAQGAALFRSPVPVQNTFAHAPVEGRVAGETEALSEGDRARAARDKPLDAQGIREVDERGSEGAASTEESKDTEDKAGDSKELSEEDQRVVESLQRRDRAVRAHEAAHMAAAGGYAAGGPSYTTEQGPDGRSYAIGGEVPIDTSAERTPEATLRKAQTIRAAAMAPADPSGADKAIAAAASQMAEQAQAAITEASAEAMEETRAAAADDAAKGTEEGDEPSAASTEGFAELRRGLDDGAPKAKRSVAANKRGKLSKAYIAMAQAPARATLRCAACAGFH